MKWNRALVVIFNLDLDIRLQGRLLLNNDEMRRKTQGQQSHNGKPSLHP
jgi:hypothetical protein